MRWPREWNNITLNLRDKKRQNLTFQIPHKRCLGIPLVLRYQSSFADARVQWCTHERDSTHEEIHFSSSMDGEIFVKSFWSTCTSIPHSITFRYLPASKILYFQLSRRSGIQALPGDRPPALRGRKTLVWRFKESVEPSRSYSDIMDISIYPLHCLGHKSHRTSPLPILVRVIHF